MNCGICRGETVVLKTLGQERRRRCTGCGHRFTTVEVLKEAREREQQAVGTVLQAAEKIKAAA